VVRVDEPDTIDTAVVAPDGVVVESPQAAAAMAAPRIVTSIKFLAVSMMTSRIDEIGNASKTFARTG